MTVIFDIQGHVIRLWDSARVTASCCLSILHSCSSFLLVLAVAAYLDVHSKVKVVCEITCQNGCRKVS